MNPRRIQLSRRKGWRMPPNTVKVDRTTRWGNPFVVKFDPHTDYSPQTADEAVILFEQLIASITPRGGYLPEKGGWISLETIRSALKGKNLACWCPTDQACHADVLLKIANKTKGNR